MPKSILELATKRKSTRKFSSDPVNLKDILQALEAATQAPSGANQQPWRFLIIIDPNLRRRVREACERGEKEFYDNVTGEFGEWLLVKGYSWRKPFLEEAPLLVAVLMDESAQYARESVWLAVGFILLALEERGLSTVTYTPSNTDLPLRELDIPEGFKLETILPIGYSAEDKPKEPKFRLEKVAFLNKWGDSIKI